MALKVSLILAGISIGLLIVYGADVLAGGGAGKGFLPFDAMTRGMGFGGLSIVLSIAAFFISRKESSKILGVLIIVSGILIIIGGTISMTMATANVARAAAEGGGLIAVGAFIVGLGSIKLRK